MDTRINRINQACAAAERIINMVECTGYDITDPSSIINGWDYCSMPDYMQYSYGASRLVVWDTEYCDYVVKVALNDRYEKFCQHEVEVYQAAVEEGLDAQFAWCMCYSEPRYNNEGEYEVPGIYVMEYVDCDEDAAEDITWKYGYEQYCSLNGLDSSDFDSADAYNDWNQGEAEERVLDYMESLMSPEYRRAFEVFMCKWWITDIHTQNVGFKGPNMVIVDYAGWNW